MAAADDVVEADLKVVASVADRPSRRMWVLALSVVSLLYFLANVDFLIRGDATTYATYILLGKFDDITLHLGYYLLMYAVQHGIAAPLGVPVQETMALANVAFGAASVALVFLLADVLQPSRLVSILTAVSFTLSGRVLMNATSSEIYMLQTACVLWSMYMYVTERAVAAGAVAGAALLVSPLSAFAFAFFPAWELTRPAGVRWQYFGKFVLAGTVVYLPYLVIDGRELLWGRRGLLLVRDATPIDLPLLMVNTVKYQVKHYTTLWLLALPAVLVVRSQRRLALLSAAVVLPHAYVVAKLTGEDHTFLLNADPFLCVWLAQGAALLLAHRGWRWAVPTVFAGHLILYAASGTIFNGVHNRGYGAEMHQIARTFLVDHHAMLITDWDVAIALTHFGRQQVSGLAEDDPLFAQMYDFTKPHESNPPLSADTLYVLDPWSPSPLNRLLRSSESLAEQAQLQSIRVGAERRLGLTCAELARGTHVLYRCQRRNSGGA